MENEHSAAALKYAIDKAKEDGRSLLFLCNSDKTFTSKVYNASKSKKRVELTLLQPIIDKYPPFLTYLEEGEAAKREAAAPALGSDDMAMLLRDLKEGQSDLKRGLAQLAANVDYTRKYIELLEKGGVPPPAPPESEGKTG